MDTVVINNITKKFEHTTAIDDLTLTIPTGQMTGIVGADAAGKTTLLRIIIGLLCADSGTVTAPTERSGDFVINNTIIHCTTMPGALLIEKCKANLRGGCHPVIITIFERVHTALNLAEDAGLAGHVEVWDIQQFLSSNVYEHSLFDESKRNSTLSDIIGRYNEIVLEAETDPSLRIEFEAR